MLHHPDSGTHPDAISTAPVELTGTLRDVPEIVAALAVHQADPARPGARQILLVVLRPDVILAPPLVDRIRARLHQHAGCTQATPVVVQVDALPLTHSGALALAAASDAVNGVPVRDRANLRNPECLDPIAAQLAPHGDDETALETFNAKDLEQSLCALCQRVFKVKIVRPTDDFMHLGADSLAILNFLAEASDRIPSEVAPESLASVSTVRQLVELCSGTAPHIAGPTQVRAVTMHDQDVVCSLLDEGFGRSLPWDRIFTHPWQAEGVPRGYALTDAGEIVGFVGLICARRMIGRQDVRVANFSSWYVRSRYRAWSNAMLAEASQDSDLTYTSLTPSKTSYRVLVEVLGFQPLDHVRLFTVPFTHVRPSVQPEPRLICDPDEIRPLLGAAEQRILDDHSRYECLAVLVKDGNEQSLLLFSRRYFQFRGHMLWPYSQLLYASTPELLGRHLERIARLATHRQRSVGITYDERAGPMTGIRFPARTLVRSTTLQPNMLDKLYSELVLLPG
jgi:hypothetical protein